MIYTFASCPLPTLSRSPKRLSRDVPKALRHYPQAFSGAPKSLSEPFSEFRWLGCSPFSLILKPHESQKRGKESVREQRLDKILKIRENTLFSLKFRVSGISKT